jgi:hypothetical protein
MIRIMTELPPSVVGFDATGTVDATDYQNVIIPEVKRLAREVGEVRILYHLGEDFEGFSLGAVIDDALVGLEHFGSWKRASVVTDKDWIHKSWGVFRLILPKGIRLFRISEFDEALAWAMG